MIPLSNVLYTYHHDFLVLKGTVISENSISYLLNIHVQSFILIYIVDT